MGPRLHRLPAAVLRRGDVLLLALLWLSDIAGLSAPITSETRWGAHVPGWLGGALVTVAYVAALRRNRHPLATLVGLGAATMVLPLLLPDVHSFFPLLFALNAAGSRLPRRVAVWGLVGSAVPLAVLLTHDLTSGGSRNRELAPFTVLIYLVLFCLAWGLGVFAAEMRARRAVAEEEAAQAAVSAERLRVARELHDIVAHAVSVMVVQAAGAQRVLESDPARARGALTSIESVGKQSMDELRRMLGALRRSDDSDTEPNTLENLPALIAGVRAAGTDVVLADDGRPGRLDPSVALAAYRVIQEALTNTTRHAGIGARAHVLLSWASDQLTIVVEDQRGATPRDEVSTLSTGHGLLGLRERVELVGGTLTVSRTTAGFRLQAELPAAAPAPEPEADPEPEPAASPESRPVTIDLTTGLLGGAT